MVNSMENFLGNASIKWHRRKYYEAILLSSKIIIHNHQDRNNIIVSYVYKKEIYFTLITSFFLHWKRFETKENLSPKKQCANKISFKLKKLNLHQIFVLFLGIPIYIVIILKNPFDMYRLNWLENCFHRYNNGAVIRVHAAEIKNILHLKSKSINYLIYIKW